MGVTPPKSSKLWPWRSIETHDDLGIPRFLHKFQSIQNNHFLRIKRILDFPWGFRNLSISKNTQIMW